MKKIFILSMVALLFLQCAEPAKNDQKFTVVCTTSMVADAMKHIFPKDVEVIALMGPGVDPHLYKATQGDLEKLQQADIVVYNGLHLEGKMADILEKMARSKTVIALGSGLSETDLIAFASNPESPDPHIWFDLSLWAKAIGAAKNSINAKHPELKEELDANFFTYEQDLLGTHNWAINQLAGIPAEKRILVTAHDAFSYFGKAYNMRVRGLQGISTASEYGLQDISSLVNFIVENQIPAVYVESSVPKKSIEAVISGCKSRGHNVVLGGQLYSDALGEANTETETLIGAFKANVAAIAGGLGAVNKTP
jgi:manganese/zinc/iron transport system substrate-binding protein